jgi:hypothetical protein
MPAPGNREYNTAGAAGYFGYFGTAAHSATDGYYSYDVGSWHIIVLNSSTGCPTSGSLSCAAGSAMVNWLHDDLLAHSNTCMLAYWHHPLFSTSYSTSPTAQHIAGSVQPLWQELYKGGADLVLNGHKHNYERFAPQDPAANATSSGIREFVVGTGGRSHEAFNASFAVASNSELRNDATFGILELTLNPTGYDYKFVPASPGTFTDSGSGSCDNNGH